MDDATAIAEGLAEYQASSAAADALVRQAGGGSYAQLPAVLRDQIDRQMRAAGMEPPQLRGRAREYAAWAQAQAPGTDASIPAFLAWRDANRAALQAQVAPYLVPALVGATAPPPSPWSDYLERERRP